ncbi:TPA: hypothetical protein SIA35_004399, partial [Aeromonas sobria]|nr:hypothetical protein [Aeromonas sobria]
IKGHKLNNTLLLPDSVGSKTGVLICLDAETPYYRIRQGSDLQGALASAMPYNADNIHGQNYYSLLAAANRRIRAPSAIDILNHIRAGRVDFEENFNFNNPQLMDVTSLSAQLANTIEADYQLKSKTITNKLLISRGIAGAHIPADASLRANYDKGYQNLSDEMKKHTYAYAIGLILHEIENDKNLPPEIKARANLAKTGGEILVPFDMGGHKLNNTILLPDSEGSKHGVLITLDSETPYYHIRQVSDLPTSLASAMPYNANKMKLKYYVTHDVKTLITPSAIMILDYLRAGDGNFERYINHDNPSPMTISDLSNKLVDNIKEDYQLKRQVITNNLLMSRAIDGANILGEGFHLIDKRYHSDLTTTDHFLDLFSNHRLRELLYSIVDNNPTEVRVAAAEYLRSIERPFATLSRDMQSVISSFRGDTVQEANRHMHEAEYIGSWIDVTVGAITSLTPEGFAFNILQSAAGIGADVLEGKALDPMAVANLVIGCTPEGKLATKIGKFSRIGGRAVKYGLMVGNKTLELAIVGESIKTAVKTGDPLAIYQALLASGMSVRSSYHMAKNMSSKLNISKNMEEIASLEQLEAIQENTPASRLSSTMTERRFRLGVTELLGRVNSGELEISSNNGVDWEKGSRLHLLAYRLQNAGGKNKLPVRDEALAFEDNLRAEEHASSAAIGREYLARHTSSVREYEPHTSGYQKNYSIYLNGINYLRTKMKLNMSKKDSRVQRFNEQTYTYENVNDYEVVPYQTTILDVDSRLDDGVVRQALNNMLLNYMSLNRIAEGYTGSSAVDFKKNIKMGAELLQEICRGLKEPSPSPSASSLHFLLIEKTAGVVTADNIIGIGKIVDLLPGSQAGEKGSIILESVIAHPYTLISKNEDFIRYAARQGLVVSPDDRARYNIKRVGSQLMHDGLKQTIQKINKEVQAGRLSRPESIQFSARNPITARMAETFGARRTDASTMDNEFMIVRAGRQSDIVLPEEHNIISFDGPRPSSRVPVRLKTPSSFLGADSSISFVGDNKGGRLVIQAHGAMANVNHLSAKELAIYLKGYTAAMGIDMKSVNMIVLRSCYSAVGGEWSTAQLLADRLGKNVTGYHGVITSQMTHNIPTAGKIFRPRKLGRGIIKAEHGHAFLHRTSAILLRMRSSLRRVPRSIEGSEFEARRPPQLNDSYKEFLTDTVALIEGDYNTALFGEKYKISIDDLLELMSSVDVNAEMSDEEFHLCFDKLFRPGLTRRNGKVKPGSVLFNKLFEYANPRFMQFPLNDFNVEEFSTNSRNEIHRGQKVLIDYSFNVQNKPDRSWVGLYRQKDLPGIDDPVIWRYLDRACSGIDIDTSSLNRGEYSVIFFYDDNYNVLEYNVNFSII